MVTQVLVLPEPVLCLVTDRRRAGGQLAWKVREAVEGGVNVVQVREKDLSTADRLTLVRQIQEAIEGKALVIVNGDINAAKLSGAEGLHLPEVGPATDTARRALGPEVLIGKSVHSVEAAVRAEDEGADYLIAGTVFETESKPGKIPEGVCLLEGVSRAVGLPFLGIGGITSGNAPEVLRSGARGVAVISTLLGSSNPKAAAQALSHALHESRADQLRSLH